MAQFSYVADGTPRRSVVSFMGHVFPTDQTPINVYEVPVIQALRRRKDFIEVIGGKKPKKVIRRVLRRKAKSTKRVSEIAKADRLVKDASD